MEGDNSFLPSCRWNMLQFFLICTYSMGVSAVWKFPHLVYVHSGLFLVAYYILLVIICVPVTFLQLKLGGIFGCGILRLFTHYTPALKGVAIAMLAYSFIECIYNNVYLAYAFYYMFAALKQPYVWTQTSNATQRVSSTYLFFGKTPSENYFFNDVLQRSGSVSEGGIVPWHLALSLLAIWLIMFLLCCRGPQWFGKVVYVTSPLAYILLFVMLIYSHTAIPSAYQSLRHFFSDQQSPSTNGHADNGHDKNGILKSQLASPLTWVRALEQHIFNIGLWAGLLPTLGAHVGKKKPANNLTCILLLLIHSILPHLATITIAPFIHALAVKKHQSFESLISEGTRLMFITLPEAFALTKVHPFWVFLFYLFFILFTLHRQALLLIVIMENIVENCTKYTVIIFRRKEILVATLCVVAYLLGLPHISQGGYYFTTLVKVYLLRLSWIIVILSIPPIVYAYAKLDSLHVPVSTLCICIWFTFATVAVGVLLIFNNVTFVGDYIEQLKYPTWSAGLGWCLAVFVPLAACVAGLAHSLYVIKGDWRQKLKSVIRPYPTPLPRMDQEDQGGQLADYTGGVEGGTLRRRQQNRLELQERKKRQENSRNNTLNTSNSQDLAESEVCLAPTQNGSITSL